MRKKADLEQAETLLTQAVLPQPVNAKFDRARWLLREFLRENQDCHKKVSIDWDPDSQEFWIDAELKNPFDCNALLGKRVFAEFRMTFKVDPKLPLMPQFECFEREMAVNNATLRGMAQELTGKKLLAEIEAKKAQ